MSTMDTSFAFPVSQTPIPRSKPINLNNNSRESNALRASVLDAALELGIGNNSLVAAWMFDNAVKEEDEDEVPVASPGLTNSSSTVSEEGTSYQYPSTPPDLSVSSNVLPAKGKPMASWDTSNNGTGIYLQTASGATSSISFPTANDIPTRPTTPGGSKKLRKKNRDGYESDGGYLSEGAKKVQKKESKARLKEEKREQKEERKRQKSLGSAIKSSKKGDYNGYETDGAAVASSSKGSFKSKSKKSKAKNTSTDAAAGYETDAGYTSAGSNLKKSKSRFFKLSLKSSRGENHPEMVPQAPPLPKEQVPLPIAERFATSLGSPTSPQKLDGPIDSRSITPLPFVSSERPPFQLPQSNSRIELPSMAPSQPFSIDTITPSQPFSIDSIVPSQAIAHPHSTAPITDRSSLSSGESSSSSQPRRVHFPPSPVGTSYSHGAGAGSISTINSSSHGSSNHSMLSSPSTSNHNPLSPSITSSKTRPSSPSTGSLRTPPTISYPLTRAASPLPPPSPIAPLNVPKNRNPPQLEIHSRGASPLPFSPNSPYVLVTPTVSHNPSPVLTSGNYPMSPPTSTTPVPAGPYHVPVRPRNPPIDGFGPRANLTSPPPTTGGRLSPTPIRTRRLSPLLVPENGDDTLPGPNVLAYYDIPPPSPPPMGPLPSVPFSAASPPPPPSAASHLRSKVLERQRNGNELSVLMGPIQRGRESPFPARPIASPAFNYNPEVPASVMSVPGLEARARVSRYRDIPPSAANDIPEASSRASPSRLMNRPIVANGRDSWEHNRVNVVPPTPSKFGSREEEVYDDEDDESEEMRDVLDRFADSGSEENSYGPDHIEGAHRPLATRRSFEALRDKHESFPVSEYYSSRDTVYAWEDNGAGNSRESRWSGSIYSRVSILDSDKSEETRDRFVRRVEAMLARKEKEENIPPVPRIPDGLANASAWNKF